MPAAIARSAATLGLERIMLVSLALVLSLAACQEPEQATGPSMSQAALPKSITLTYICGNSFRVRNTNPNEITVTWDVYQKGETGTLLLPPKPASAPYSETYFTTVNKGTVRLFLDGVLIQTKANGNKPACELASGGPTIPGPLAPRNDVRSLIQADRGESSVGSTVVLQDRYQIRFVPGVTDAAKTEPLRSIWDDRPWRSVDRPLFRPHTRSRSDVDRLGQRLDRIIADPWVDHATPIIRG